MGFAQTVRFFNNYPVAYYLRNMLPRPQQRRAAVLLQPDGFSVLVEACQQQNRVLDYRTGHAHLKGSPSLDAKHSNAWGTQFFTEILVPNKMLGERMVLVVEDSKLSLLQQSIDAKKYPNNAAFLRQLDQNPAPIFGQIDWKNLSWTLLNAQLQPFHPEGQDKQVILAGLPTEPVDLLTRWFDEAQVILDGIIPAPLAVCSWFIEKFPQPNNRPCFLLYSNSNRVVFFKIRDKQCYQVITHPTQGTVLLSNQELLLDLASNLFEAAESSDKSSGEHPPLYIWEGNSQQKDDPKRRTQQYQRELNYQNTTLLNKETIDKTLTLNTGVDIGEDAFLLDWAAEACHRSHHSLRYQLCSDQYRERRDWCENQLFKGTWYIITLLVLLQALVIWRFYCAYNEHQEAQHQLSIAQAAEAAAETRSTSMIELQNQLKDLERWNRHLKARQRVGPILAAIEKNIPNEIGLTEINITFNRDALIGGRAPKPDTTVIKLAPDPEIQLTLKGVCFSSKPDAVYALHAKLPEVFDLPTTDNKILNCDKKQFNHRAGLAFGLKYTFKDLKGQNLLPSNPTETTSGPTKKKNQ